ncbi:hypothetical protein Tdes44962_MAKER01507 [Teratosphaeria destructans]|uniref:Uncharacterized protein n=1 Tax=Teratosphaeria destructans TaxID=418781 RepID=A0A9W7W5X9_9PEZI|nr:hypothetical protein Tdes44962_MAKER01507 [Teratosphaeria destructans]
MKRHVAPYASYLPRSPIMKLSANAWYMQCCSSKYILIGYRAGETPASAGVMAAGDGLLGGFGVALPPLLTGLFAI